MAQFFDFEQDYYGLTRVEIEKQLSMYGLNTYKKDDKNRKAFSLWEILLSPAVILMFISGVMCILAKWVGAGIIALLIDTLYVLAEMYIRKSADERFEEVRENTVMKFRVIREGKLQLISKDEIVPEDIIVLQAGERIPADAAVLEARDLKVDENIFTGTHIAVEKYAGGEYEDDLKPNVVYSGTIVLTGTAICKVSATGVDTRLYQHFGEIPDDHPYYTQIEKIARSLVPVAGCVAVGVAFASMITRIAVGNDAIFATLGGLTMGLCFIPVGLGSVVRMCYTKAATDLMNSGATVKSFSDIEKLNSLSVLCVEKEGAISKNRLEVRGIYARKEELLYRVAALSGEPNSQDPAIQALMVKATFFDEKIKNIYEENKFIKKLPESNGTFSGAIWNIGGDRLCCIRGVPEQILPMCKMSGETMLAAKKRCEDYYAKGCTVIAVACVDANREATDLTAGFSYMFIGFAAFSAPLRDSVTAAVKTCRRAGVRVIMLSEENPSIAESTGRMIGIQTSSVISGTDIEAAKSGEAALDLKSDIYAKLDSEQKKYVIEQLKNSGEVVAMAGTRVEDADVVETADIGITIAQTTAGCIYETADILMGNDNFNSIANMIYMARNVHRNIKSAVLVIISGVLALITLMTVNSFTNTDQMLTPPIIALFDMCFVPLCAMSFRGKELDRKTILPPSGFVAKRKLNLRFIGKAAIFGVATGVVGILTYLFNSGLNVNFARSCSLVTLCFAFTGFVLAEHLEKQPLRAITALRTIEKAALCVVPLLPIALVYIPLLNAAFGLCAVNFLALFISIISGIVPAVIYLVVVHFLKFKEQV